MLQSIFNFKGYRPAYIYPIIFVIKSIIITAVYQKISHIYRLFMRTGLSFDLVEVTKDARFKSTVAVKVHPDCHQHTGCIGVLCSEMFIYLAFAAEYISLEKIKLNLPRLR